jgi:ribosomal protein S18 acetylase RimI-like enzyme
VGPPSVPAWPPVPVPSRMTVPDIRIARATAADAPRLAPIFDAYRIFYRKPSDIPGAEAFLRERLERNESALYTALARPSNPCDGERVAGFVQLYPSFSSSAMRSSWILNDLYVADAFRRRGVAKLLMAAAADHARATGARSLTLVTEETNTSAQALYESLGWTCLPFRFYYTLVVEP